MPLLIEINMMMILFHLLVIGSHGASVYSPVPKKVRLECFDEAPEPFPGATVMASSSIIGVVFNNTPSGLLQPSDFRAFRALGSTTFQGSVFLPEQTTVKSLSNTSVLVSAHRRDNSYTVFTISSILWVTSINFIAIGTDGFQTEQNLDCFEQRIAACSLLDHSTLIFPLSQEIIVGKPVELQIAPSDPSKIEEFRHIVWFLSVSGASNFADLEMVWVEDKSRFSINVTFPTTGQHVVSIVLRFPDKNLAFTHEVAIMELEGFLEMYCGDKLADISINVKGQPLAGVFGGHWSQNNRKWIPAHGHSLYYYSLAELETEIFKRNWSEIVFFGDSREISMMDMLEMHVLQLRKSYDDPKVGWKLGNIETGSMTFFDYKNISFQHMLARSHKNDLEDDLEPEQSVWDFIWKLVENAMELKGTCMINTKGLLLVSMALYDIRHLGRYKDGFELYLGNLTRRCPNHQILFLTMQAQHDETAEYRSFFEQNHPFMSWFPRQNSQTLKKANEIGIRTAEKLHIDVCDLYSPTVSRESASIDGTHYDGRYNIPNPEGLAVIQELLQIVWNCVF